MQIALVTNAPEENVEAIMLALELRDIFDVVVLADEVEAVKPDPAPYKAALKKTGVPAERALAFEDSVSGISSSVAAGIPTVGIASSQDPEKLLGSGAFMTAKDFTDPHLRALIDPKDSPGVPD
jgi:beta-phosphoglucomutase-like phosphatase (HAD superfamily)